jgi:hypothetical protein
MVVLLVCGVGAWAQNSSSSSNTPPDAPTPQPGATASKPDSASTANKQDAGSRASKPGSGSTSGGQDSTPSAGKPAKPHEPDFSPPRSDAGDSGIGEGQSSSKDTQIDLSPPPGDAQTHPQSREALKDAGFEDAAGGDVAEFHPWDPHKAAKDVEVGDFYFKRKNYKAAEDRYREALYYKDNDAMATFRLAVCLEKMGRPDDARTEYESYLKILPHGPEAAEAQKAIERLKGPAADKKTTK